MNVMTLLATGKSVIGMKDQNSPYKMRAENLLPKFESAKNPYAPAPKPASANPQTPAVPAAEKSIVTPQPAFMETLSLFDTAFQPATIHVAVCEEASGEAEMVPIKVLEIAAPAPVVALDNNNVDTASDMAEAPASPAPVAAAPHKTAPVQRTPAVANRPPRVTETAPRVTSTSDAASAPDATCNTSLPPASKYSFISRWLKPLNPFVSTPKNVRNKSGAPVQAEFALERIKVVRNDLNDTDLEIIAVKPPEKAGVMNSRLQPAAKTAAAAFNRLTSRFMGAEQAQVR